MKFADAIATHKSAEVGPDAYTTIRDFGKAHFGDKKGRIRSAMILLIAAGYVTVSKNVRNGRAVFQATKFLTKPVLAAADKVARLTGYDLITPKITRAQARKLLKNDDDSQHKAARLGKG